MMQYVCSTHIDEYDWFLRTVDDCYVRPERLLTTVSYLDKRKKVQWHPR